MSTGTHSLNDLLQMKNTTVVDYGYENAVAVVNREIAAHNAVLNGMTSDLAETTMERAGTSGASTDGRMVKAEEHSRTATQKGNKFATVAFPLDKFQFSIGWTEEFFKAKSVADLALAVQRAQRADILGLQLGIKNAVFLSTNYSFVDEWVDNATLAIKRFVNADSDVIPTSPVTGQSFDTSTHTHYDGSATLTTTALDALISDVVEHGHGAGVRVYINRAQEATVRGLAGFVAYLDARIIGATNANQAQGTLDVSRVDNRAIGLYNGAEIWVKSWIPASYLFAFASGDANKPLAYRIPPAAALQGLQLAAENSAFPLHAQFFERRFGFAVKTRTNGAVLYIGGGTYVDPVIT